MGTFSKDVLLNGSQSLIPSIAVEIEHEFMSEGYEVSVEELHNGAYDISITKGGTFKAILGMRTALKINLIPHHDGIKLKADVGIWGQQAVPFAISMLLFWPVLLTQMWGLIQQSQLDDKAVAIANRVIRSNKSSDVSGDSFANIRCCKGCGAKLNDPSARFCPSCGTAL